MSERRPLNEKEYYHWYEYQGELTIESECCLDRFSADEEQVLLRYLLGKYPQPTDLTALRAEVVEARDADKDDPFFYAMEGVYDLVLDLIDKHREGH